VSEISRIVIVNIFPVWNYIDMAIFNEEQRSTRLFSFGKRAGKVCRFRASIMATRSQVILARDRSPTVC